MAVLVEFQSAGRRIQQIGVRSPAGRHEQGGRFERLERSGAAAAGHVDRDTVGTALDRERDGVEQHPVPLRGQLGETLGDLLVFRHEQARRPRHDRDPGTKRAEYMSQLGSDVATADDNERWRNVVDAHDGVGGVELDRCQAVDRRYERP
ncbi:MAG TPA: hypothetical protein VI365_25615 [Trebonia sp.]